MSDDKLRVGIIGTGLIGTVSHIPELLATGRVEVVAVCRRNAEKLAMVQRAFGVPSAYTDWREMIDQAPLDAVVVSTPHHYHTQPTLGALAQGLHVFVQKPMALTSKDAWAMLEAAERADRVLMVHGAGEDGIWRTVKGQIEEGSLGPLRQINMAQNSYRRWFWGVDPLPDGMQAMGKMMADKLGLPFEFFDGWPGWQGDPEKMGGGTFVDLGVYQVTLALWLAGVPPLEVVAFTESAGLPVEAFVNTQARLANDVLFSMTFADAIREPFMGARFGRPSVTIIGDEALLFQDKQGTVWLHRGGEREKLESEVEDTTAMAAFVSTVLDGSPPLIPPEVGAWAVEFIEATYASAAEGRIARIERAESP